MKKICPGCGAERDANCDFNWKHMGRGIRNARCKYCQSLASKLHYHKNKQSYLNRTRTREIQVIENNQKRFVQVAAKNAISRETSPGKIRQKERANVGVSFARLKLIRHTAKITSKSILIALLLAMIESIPKTNKNFTPTYLLIPVLIAVKLTSASSSLTMCEETNLQI